MYNPDNNMVPVVGTFFVCQQIAFYSFVAVVFSDAIVWYSKTQLKVGRGSHPVKVQLFNPCHLYHFTLKSRTLSVYEKNSY